MIEIGKRQFLTIVQKTDFGLYLDAETENRSDNILLPQNQVDSTMDLGQKVEVFIYRDSADRLIATCKKPMIELGQVARLEVKEMTDIGAFLNWGLEKDLFLPFREQKYDIEVGKSYLVALYLDKSQRLCATTDIYNYLKSDSSHQAGDHTKAFVCKYNRDIGLFVAVEDQYFGLIDKSELFNVPPVGCEIAVKVVKVHKDGKLVLTMREALFTQIDKDCKVVLQALEKGKGLLNLNDHSAPEEISAKLKMSKKSFKRAVGVLLKDGTIDFFEDKIRLKKGTKSESENS